MLKVKSLKFLRKRFAQQVHSIKTKRRSARGALLLFSNQHLKSTYIVHHAVFIYSIKIISFHRIHNLFLQRNNFALFISDIESIKSSYGSSLLDKTSMRTRRTLSDLLPGVAPDALSLLQNLLQFNPDKRMTAEEALTHPYLAKFHKPSEEHILTYDVVPPVDDDTQLSVDEYRSKLYDVSLFTLFAATA